MESLVAALKDMKVVQSTEVENAMLTVDRVHFCPGPNPYADDPMKIGFGATISAPHMHGFALDCLVQNLKDGAKVLDVGSGTGYLTACFAKMVHPTGSVYGIEHIPELAKLSEDNLKNAFGENIMNIHILVQDGRLGLQSEAPFDAIHVGAASEEVPELLINQLKPGGRMVIPIGKPGHSQKMRTCYKQLNGKVISKDWMGVRYVPLTSVEEQMTNKQLSPSDYHGKGNIGMLSRDIIFHIFSYLPLKHWMICEQVSHDWFDILASRWRTLQFVNLGSLMGLTNWQTPRCDMYMSLQKTPTIALFRLRALASRCGSQLTSIASGAHFRMSVRCVSLIGQHFQHLTNLSLSAVTILPDQFIENQSCDEDDLSVLENSDNFDKVQFPNLLELNLKNCFNENSVSYYSDDEADEVAYKILASCSKLKKLSLNFNTLLHGPCLFALNPITLTNLSLQFCRRMSTEMLQVAFGNFSNLQHVSLYSICNLQGVALLALCPTLMSIDISYCDSLTADVLVEFFNTHKDLKRIKMSHLMCLSDPVLTAMSDLTNLTRLDLANYFCFLRHSSLEFSVHHSDISKGLSDLKYLGQLEFLDLTKNEFITDDHLACLCQSLKQLKCLKLGLICGLTDVGLRHIAALSELVYLDVSETGISGQTLLSIAHNTKLETVVARQIKGFDYATLTELKGQWPEGREITCTIF